MTTETILTDEQVRNIIEGVAWPNEEVFKFTVDAARAIEQAVLQSPEIQEMRKDSERIQFVADEYCVFDTWIQEDGTTKYRLEWNPGSSVSEWQDRWFDSPREAINAAMEQQT